MKGFPKHFNSKKDIIFCLDKWPEQVKNYLQTLLDNRHSWLIDYKMNLTETGIEDDTHTVREIYDDKTEELTEKYQMIYKEDPNCKLFRLGFTVQQAQNLI